MVNCKICEKEIPSSSRYKNYCSIECYKQSYVGKYYYGIKDNYDFKEYNKQKSRNWRLNNPEKHKQAVENWRVNNLQRWREIQRRSENRRMNANVQTQA